MNATPSHPTLIMISVPDRGFTIDQTTDHGKLLEQIATLVIQKMCEVNMTPEIIASGGINIHLCIRSQEWKRLRAPYKKDSEVEEGLNLAIRTQLSTRPATRVTYSGCKYQPNQSGCTFSFAVR